jgi:hypothetical protein
VRVKSDDLPLTHRILRLRPPLPAQNLSFKPSYSMSPVPPAHPAEELAVSGGSPAPQSTSPPENADRRDLRLDACRGLALWFIFLDHVPA